MSICITANDTMPIPRPVSVRIECDACDGYLWWVQHGTIEHPWTVANREGWLMTPEKHLCGACRRPRAAPVLGQLSLLGVALALMLLAVPAAAQTEHEYVEHLCAGMEIEVTLPDSTRVDCLSDHFAIEVGFSETWAESIGQSLHYGHMTGRQPVILMLCRPRTAIETCLKHWWTTLKTVRAWSLPVEVWLHSGGLP